jgi:hypothetical protein
VRIVLTDGLIQKVKENPGDLVDWQDEFWVAVNTLIEEVEKRPLLKSASMGVDVTLPSLEINMAEWFSYFVWMLRKGDEILADCENIPSLD